MQITKDLHAGLIEFIEGTEVDLISKAAKELSKLTTFQHIWVRRTSHTRWGIEFLFECNNICEKKDISKEIDYLLTKINKIIPKEKVYRPDISSEVIIIK